MSENWKEIKEGYYENDACIVKFALDRYYMEFFKKDTEEETRLSLDDIKGLLELAERDMARPNNYVEKSNMLVEFEPYSRMSLGVVNVPTARFFVGGELFVQTPDKHDDCNVVTFTWVKSTMMMYVDGLEQIIDWLDEKVSER